MKDPPPDERGCIHDASTNECTPTPHLSGGRRAWIRAIACPQVYGCCQKVADQHSGRPTLRSATLSTFTASPPRAVSLSRSGQACTPRGVHRPGASLGGRHLESGGFVYLGAAGFKLAAAEPAARYPAQVRGEAVLAIQGRSHSRDLELSPRLEVRAGATPLALKGPRHSPAGATTFPRRA